MPDRKEVFIERNVKLSRKDLLRIKCVVIPKLLENFPCLDTGAFHQSVEYFEVRRAPGSVKVVDVGCQDLVDFYPSCRRFRFSHPCTLNLLANVEGFARHIAVARLA